MGERTYLKNTIIKCGSCGHANIFNQPYPYHAGFSDQGFLYNDAGHLTLTWSCYDPAFERIVGGKNPWTLTLAEQQKVEDALLPAPSGGRWRFSNPARCLNCSSEISGPIIDPSITCFMTAASKPMIFLPMTFCLLSSFDPTPNPYEGCQR